MNINMNINLNTESPSKIIEKHNLENTPPGFFSRVEEYPVKYQANSHGGPFGVRDTLFPASSHKVLVNSYTQRPVGVVGSGYKVQQMEEYTQAAENLLMDILPPAHFKGLQITDSMSHHSAVRARKYTFPSVGMPIETKKHRTDTGLTLVMLQSYDGSGSNGFLTGLIDYHCLNGMVSGDFSRGNKRHTSGFNLGEFILQIERMTQEYYKSIRRYQSWAGKEIPLFAAESVIDSLPGMSKRRGKKLKEQFLLEVSTRGSNMWALASALTYYASHNSSSFPVKGSAANDNETKALLVRGRQVTRWLESKQFQSLAQAAA
mgnify:CR=1 FL=1